VPLPEELGVVLERVAERLPNRSLIVAGNGVATKDDDWRGELLRDTVDVLTDAHRGGIPVVGYFHDTGIDGYEWRAGFETQRGLIDRARTIKPSGEFFASMSPRRSSA